MVEIELMEVIKLKQSPEKKKKEKKKKIRKKQEKNMKIKLGSKFGKSLLFSNFFQMP